MNFERGALNFEPGTRLRLFVAIDLPADWRMALTEEARRLESAAPGFGRWVGPEQMHVTLAFLGSQPESLLPSLDRTLRPAAAARAPFSLAPGALGGFGGPRSLRVVWAGVRDSPPGALAALREAVTEGLDAASVEYDRGPFRPHITLARARREASAQQSQAMHRAIAARVGWGAGRAAVAEVREITLFRSELRPSGARYTALVRAPLGGSTPDD